MPQSLACPATAWRGQRWWLLFCFTEQDGAQAWQLKRTQAPAGCL